MSSNGMAARNRLAQNGFPLAPLNAEKLRRLDETLESVSADDLGKWDCRVKRADLAFKDGSLAFGRDNGEEHRLTPTTWAGGQMCARLGIPVAYFRKCPPVLQDVQANFWLKETPNAHEQWFLRSRNETVRAVLSDKYSPLDNATLLNSLVPLLQVRYRVDWFGLSDEGLHLRVVDPQKTREILPDDAVSVGIHIANSEVGFRSVTVDALVYRLICKNGLIRLVKGKSLLRQRHIHVAQPHFVAALEEAVSQALESAGTFMDELARTTKEPVGDVEETLKKLGQRWGLSQSTQESVKGALLQEKPSQQETIYGLVNAFTNAAQRLPDEARYDLEVLAGHLAQHGVAAYAPPRKKNHVETGAIVEEDDSAETENGVPASWSAFELAREMFDAEIISRIPHNGEVAR